MSFAGQSYALQRCGIVTVEGVSPGISCATPSTRMRSWSKTPDTTFAACAVSAASCRPVPPPSFVSVCTSAVATPTAVEYS